MKRFLVALSMLAVCASAYASCRYYTINQGGRIVYCTECCYYGNCHITCN